MAFNVFPGRPGENAPATLRAVATEVAHSVTVTEHSKATDRGTRVVEIKPVCVTGEQTHALTVSQKGATEDGTGRGTPITATQSVVRRLTPIECCRLQGFPDNWNSEGIDKSGKRFSMADAPRYRQLGNAVTVNVANWIANNLARVYTAAKESHDG
jgi:site-specific DNA-cytosine methylase